MPLAAGTRLGAYEILSVLSAGGMGEVYRGWDTKLGRDVAVKVLLPAVAGDPERLARFNREAQLLASLNHPNIAHCRSRLTWYDRTGKSLGAFGGAGRYLSLSLSPDEKRIAVDADSDVAPGYRIFVIDHERDTTAQLTVGNATGNFPVWSPDGRQLAFGSNREGVYNIYVKPSTGAGQEDLVLRNDRNKFLSDWSRDGRFLLYGQSAGTNHTDLWTLPMIGDHKPMLYLRGTGEMRGGCFSPDGRWVAYQSDESSRYEIYVQSFPAGAEKVQISTNGGTRPKWRADGKELYYLTLTGTLMAVPVKPGPAFAAGVPETLFQTWSSGILLGYAASRDGGRFVFLAPEEDRAAEPVTVILNRP